LPHGGPDPNPNLRPGGRPRNRRQAEEDYESADGSLVRYDKTNPMTGIKQITRDIENGHKDLSMNVMDKENLNIKLKEWEDGFNNLELIMLTINNRYSFNILNLFYMDTSGHFPCFITNRHVQIVNLARYARELKKAYIFYTIFFF